MSHFRSPFMRRFKKNIRRIGNKTHPKSFPFTSLRLNRYILVGLQDTLSPCTVCNIFTPFVPIWITCYPPLRSINFGKYLRFSRLNQWKRWNSYLSNLEKKKQKSYKLYKNYFFEYFIIRFLFHPKIYIVDNNFFWNTFRNMKRKLRIQFHDEKFCVFTTYILLPTKVHLKVVYYLYSACSNPTNVVLRRWLKWFSWVWL